MCDYEECARNLTEKGSVERRGSITDAGRKKSWKGRDEKKKRGTFLTQSDPERPNAQNVFEKIIPAGKVVGRPYRRF